jgi:hypothetical protein
MPKPAMFTPADKPLAGPHMKGSIDVYQIWLCQFQMVQGQQHSTQLFAESVMGL